MRETKDEMFLHFLQNDESYEESANAANSWLHLHNTHQADLSPQAGCQLTGTRTNKCTHVTNFWSVAALNKLRDLMKAF